MIISVFPNLTNVGVEEISGNVFSVLSQFNTNIYVSGALSNVFSDCNVVFDDEQEIMKKCDVAIAIGGDGAFLRMVKDTNFDDSVYYIGINTGTLGFLQEIRPNNLRSFIEALNNDDFKVDNIGVLETKVSTDDSISRYYALNEVVVRELELNALLMDIHVDHVKLETYMGDGVLISTSVGSSAYNTSFRGALVYNTLHTLQIMPIAPINTKAYRNLLNPIVLPEKKHIELYPLKKTILLTFDGENKRYNNVKKIECFVKNKREKGSCAPAYRPCKPYTFCSHRL